MIYLIMKDDGDDYEYPVGYFTNKDDAERYCILENENRDYGAFSVEPFEELPHPEQFNLYHEYGVTFDKWRDDAWKNPRITRYIPYRGDIRQTVPIFYEYGYRSEFVVFITADSEDEARTVATEIFNKWLEENKEQKQ